LGVSVEVFPQIKYKKAVFKDFRHQLTSRYKE